MLFHGEMTTESISKPIQVFSEDKDCRALIRSNAARGDLPRGESYDGKNQKAFLLFDSSNDDTNAYPKWGQWT